MSVGLSVAWWSEAQQIVPVRRIIRRERLRTTIEHVDRTQIMGAVVSGPLWARSVQNISGRVIVGVAIHYTGP
jgi:hypothetical protein